MVTPRLFICSNMLRASFLALFLVPMASHCATPATILAASGPWYPFAYYDPTRHPVGIAVDLLDEIGRRTHMQFQFGLLPIRRLNRMVTDGGLELNIVQSRAREIEPSSCTYTHPYLWLQEHVYILKGGKPFKVMDDLVGQRLGTVRGYSLPVLTKHLANTQVQQQDYPDAPTLIKALFLHRVDAIILDNMAFEYLGKNHLFQNGDMVPIMKVSSIPISMQLCGKLADDVELFNQAIDETARDGTLKVIIDSNMNSNLNHRTI
jgi:ABC-type amino acid transport substrate-binding protein